MASSAVAGCVAVTGMSPMRQAIAVERAAASPENKSRRERSARPRAPMELQDVYIRTADYDSGAANADIRAAPLDLLRRLTRREGAPPSDAEAARRPGYSDTVWRVCPLSAASRAGWLSVAPVVGLLGEVSEESIPTQQGEGRLKPSITPARVQDGEILKSDAQALRGFSPTHILHMS